MTDFSETRRSLVEKSSSFSVFDRFESGRSVKEVADAKKITIGTAVTYLCDYIRFNNITDVSIWVEEATVKRVHDVTKKLGYQALKPIYLGLEEKVSYDEIRISVAVFRNMEEDSSKNKTTDSQSSSASTATEPRKVLSLFAIASRMEQIIHGKTEGIKFWLKAEISSGRAVTKGHFYCDFVQSHNGNQVAKIRGMIWASELERIQNKFKASGIEFKLESGIEITVYCQIRFHKVYGLSIEVVDADPAFALGELERTRREVLLRLEKEGLFDRNNLIRVQVLPKRIGIITSQGTASHNDFVRTIEQSGFAFSLLFVDARMQGKRTEGDVCDAIAELESLRPDLIVILRGGGSKLDLGYLDSEVIARQIAKSWVPIWTAIGHETDKSVLDYVAHSSFKTPTAAASAIVSIFAAMEIKLNHSFDKIKNAWERNFSGSSFALVTKRERFTKSADQIVRSAQSQLTQCNSRIKFSVVNRISVRERQALTGVTSKFKTSALSKIVHERQAVDQFRESLRAKTRARFRERGLLLVASRAWFNTARILSKINVYRKLVVRNKKSLRDSVQKRLTGEQRLVLAARPNLTLIKFKNRVKEFDKQLALKGKLLKSLDPVSNLQRGYAIVVNANERLVMSVRNLEKDQQISIRMFDGTIGARVNEVNPSE